MDNKREYYQIGGNLQPDAPSYIECLVLALDDVDTVFEKRELADDFCILLRHWHHLARNGQHNSIIWAKLRLIIVYSTSINTKTSPLYNVGYPAKLIEFNIDEIRKFTSYNGFTWRDEQLEH